MTVASLEILVEELSAERALEHLIPRIAPGMSFEIRTFNGKPDLLRKLPSRMAGYARYVRAAGIGLVVLVDRDSDDCRVLKSELEKCSTDVGLSTLSTASGRSSPIVANRLACEELEAWFFGDVPALAKAFPGVPASLGERASYRDPDAVTGGTAEALERVIRRHGHHRSGLRKTSAATDVALHMDVENNRSNSFVTFRDGIRRLVEGDH